MTPTAIQITAAPNTLASEVEALAATNLASCLQCRKCSSGCPVAARADIQPHELIRMVQLDQRDEVLACRMIWECTSCQTCVTRCPQKVSAAALNDALRQLSKRDAKVAAGTTVAAFNEIFLKIIRKRGRIFEMGLMTAFKLRTRNFFADVSKLPMMLRKRKLSLLPTTVPGKEARKNLFDRSSGTGAKP